MTPLPMSCTIDDPTSVGSRKSNPSDLEQDYVKTQVVRTEMRGILTPLFIQDIRLKVINLL